MRLLLVAAGVESSKPTSPIWLRLPRTVLARRLMGNFADACAVIQHAPEAIQQKDHGAVRAQNARAGASARHAVALHHLQRLRLCENGERR